MQNGKYVTIVMYGMHGRYQRIDSTNVEGDGGTLMTARPAKRALVLPLPTV